MRTASTSPSDAGPVPRAPVNSRSWLSPTKPSVGGVQTTTRRRVPRSPAHRTRSPGRIRWLTNVRSAGSPASGPRAGHCEVDSQARSVGPGSGREVTRAAGPRSATAAPAPATATAAAPPRTRVRRRTRRARSSTRAAGSGGSERSWRRTSTASPRSRSSAHSAGASSPRAAACAPARLSRRASSRLRSVGSGPAEEARDVLGSEVPEQPRGEEGPVERVGGPQVGDEGVDHRVRSPRRAARASGPAGGVVAGRRGLAAGHGRGEDVPPGALDRSPGRVPVGGRPRGPQAEEGAGRDLAGGVRVEHDEAGDRLEVAPPDADEVVEHPLAHEVSIAPASATGPRVVLRRRSSPCPRSPRRRRRGGGRR